MNFDTLTIAGILSAILSGGFLIALVLRNDTRERPPERLIGRAPEAVESRP
jgi:hypothetical protein